MKYFVGIKIYDLVMIFLALGQLEKGFARAERVYKARCVQVKSDLNFTDGRLSKFSV